MSIEIDAESVYPKITVRVLTPQGTKSCEEIASHWKRNVIEDNKVCPDVAAPCARDGFITDTVIK
jgi:hypothetical protein